MKTVINTNTAGRIVINSTFKGDKLWKALENVRNYNRHIVTISHNKKRLSFEFWSSLNEGELKTDESNVSAFYCFLSDSCAGEMDVFDFISEFGYEDIKEAKRIYKACEKSLLKFKNVFACDLYELINEIQDTYNC